MIPALILDAAWEFLKRYWPWVLGAAVVLGITGTIAIQHWRINSLTAARATDRVAIEAAVSANAKNTRAIAEIKAQDAADRAATAKMQAQIAGIAATADHHIQEIQNDPGATVPAGPELDDLGDRLRAIDAGRDRDASRLP